MNTPSETYRFCSVRQRLYQSVIVIVSSAVLGGFLIAVLRGAGRIAAVGVIVAAALVGTRRAFRLELVATSRSVSIKNYWRSYEFEWGDVTDVGVGTLTMGAIPQTTVAFLLRSGKGPRAQATPPKVTERVAMFEALRRLAPSNVVFHDRD